MFLEDTYASVVQKRLVYCLGCSLEACVRVNKERVQTPLVSIFKTIQFFNAIWVIDIVCFFFIFIFVVLTATCRVRSCYCWFVNNDSSLRLKESFFSSFSFLWTFEHIDDLVVYNPATFPTTLMIRLFHFKYETLFSKLQQTINNSKTQQ